LSDDFNVEISACLATLIIPSPKVNRLMGNTSTFIKGKKMTETKISYEDFAKVQILAGTIVRAEEFARAKKPAYKVWVDFGNLYGIKQTSAQITTHYQLETLIGKKVLGCVNLGSKNIAGFMSEFLLLGFNDTNATIRLATFDGDVANGEKLC